VLWPNLFTEERVAAICLLFEEGAQERYIESITNLPQGTIQSWLEEGERELDRLAAVSIETGEDPDKLFRQSPIVSFSRRVYEAKYEQRGAAVRTIRDSIDLGDVKTAKWYLEMVYAEEAEQRREERELINQQIGQLKALKLLKELSPEAFREKMRHLGLAQNEVHGLIEDLNQRSKDKA